MSLKNQELLAQFNSIVNEMKQSFQDSSKEQTEAIIRCQADMLSKLGDTLAAKLTPPQPPLMSPSLTLPVTQPMSNGGMEPGQVGSPIFPVPCGTSLPPSSDLLAHSHPLGHFVGDASSGLTAHAPEETRTLLGIPPSSDSASLSELLVLRSRAALAYSDIRRALQFDQQQLHVVQTKDFDYIKAFKGNPQLHEATVKRIDVVDRHLARLQASANRERKKFDEPSLNKPSGFQFQPDLVVCIQPLGVPNLV
ncbi:hypothetical protein TCAL_15525 [Tigriopus californicus]|uniref:Uncharacterized protein n=1 Tax=Tigriopus californicus TaxID=6832 RepID=A0A553PTK3_TIGCA|nr:hypothetical protein TCAL_15525 [Tigriopus californicus]